MTINDNMCIGNVDLTRRSFLVVAGLTGLTPAAPAMPAAPDLPSPPDAPTVPAAPAVVAGRRTLAEPFGLGIASGDPAPDGVVLWTRLAPDPLAEGGHGGMPARDIEVDWQLAEDERFRRGVRRGRVIARHASAHSVHVEADGLEPGREYFYRFRAGGHLSPTGRTRTVPTPGTLPPLTFAVASCAQYEHGYFTAYRRIADQDPDLVVHLGDYMYEYAPGGYRAPSGIVRDHTEGKCQTLADYRRRHAQYKADPDLRAAHAAAPWIVSWDDHELENNWAGDDPGTEIPAFTERKRAAFRAYYENMPLRRTSIPRGTDMRLYRRLHWGALATFHVLDTRQFRSDQPCADGIRAGCDERLAQRRTLTGGRQRRWLADGLRDSTARWDVLAQQVFLAQRDWRLGPGQEVLLDAWDGYAAERDGLLGDLTRARNPVVLTGDVHCHFANNLLTSFDDPAGERVGVELVVSSVASDGDGYRDWPQKAMLLAENPHIDYIGPHRGYLLCHVTPAELRADFRTLSYVTRRGARASTAASFTIADGARSLT